MCKSGKTSDLSMVSADMKSAGREIFIVVRLSSSTGFFPLSCLGALSGAFGLSGVPSGDAKLKGFACTTTTGVFFSEPVGELPTFPACDVRNLFAIDSPVANPFRNSFLDFFWSLPKKNNQNKIVRLDEQFSKNILVRLKIYDMMNGRTITFHIFFLFYLFFLFPFPSLLCFFFGQSHPQVYIIIRFIVERTFSDTVRLKTLNFRLRNFSRKNTRKIDICK